MPAIFSESFDSYVCDGESIKAESDGFTIVATVESDCDAGPPWENCDGHGPVSDWTSRAKAPGELILSRDGASRRYYDFAAAVKLARRDGWGSKPYDVAGETPRQKAARAAMADYEALQAWCDDDWHYVGIVVTASRDGLELGSARLWGIDCNYPGSDNAYLRDVAEELAPEAIGEAKAKLAALCECHV